MGDEKDRDFKDIIDGLRRILEDQANKMSAMNATILIMQSEHIGIKGNVDKLLKTLLDGNGAPSLMTKMALQEQSITAIKLTQEKNAMDITKLIEGQQKRIEEIEKAQEKSWIDMVKTMLNALIGAIGAIAAAALTGHIHV